MTEFEKGRIVALEEAKNAFRLLRASFPQAVGTDWETIAGELTRIASLPASLVLVERATVERVRDLLSYLERFGMEDDGSSHSIDADVRAALALLAKVKP